MSVLFDYSIALFLLATLPRPDDTAKTSIVHTETIVLTQLHLNVFRSYLTPSLHLPQYPYIFVLTRTLPGTPTPRSKRCRLTTIVYSSIALHPRTQPGCIIRLSVVIFPFVSAFSARLCISRYHQYARKSMQTRKCRLLAQCKFDQIR